MSNAKHDENGIATKLGILNTDGITPINISVSSSTHRLKVGNGTSNVYSQSRSLGNAEHDENSTPTVMGVSSLDGKTVMSLLCDANGYLLIQTN